MTDKKRVKKKRAPVKVLHDAESIILSQVAETSQTRKNFLAELATDAGKILRPRILNE